MPIEHIGEIAIGSGIAAVIGGVWAGLRFPARKGVDPMVRAGEIGERLVEATLMDAGIPTLRNVFISSWRENQTEIDLMALVGAEIVVIEVKAWAGEVDGQSDAGEWRLRKRFSRDKKLRNPLLQNRCHVGHAQRAFPRARMSSLVVFTKASFVGEVPAGVFDLDGLRLEIADRRGEEPDNSTVFAWGKLSAISGSQDKGACRDRLVARVAEASRKDEYAAPG